MLPYQTSSPKELHQLLEIPFRGIESATAVLVLDTDGAVLAPPYYPSEQEAAGLGREAVTRLDLELFAKHIPYALALSTDIAIGSIYYSSGGKPRVAMATAFGLKNGRPTRILAVERALDDICGLVSSYEYTPSRDARILDGKGRTVCGPDGRFPGKLIFYQNDHCSYKQADTGLSSFKWMRDKSVQCDSARVKRTDWRVSFERFHGELAWCGVLGGCSGGGRARCSWPWLPYLVRPSRLPPSHRRPPKWTRWIADQSVAMAELQQVECYAGYQAEQEPRALVVGGRRLRVLAIARRWYEPQAAIFRVRVEDGHLYQLRYERRRDRWSLDAVVKADS